MSFVRKPASLTSRTNVTLQRVLSDKQPEEVITTMGNSLPRQDDNSRKRFSFKRSVRNRDGVPQDGKPMSEDQVDGIVHRLKIEVDEFRCKKQCRLKELDLFILDNSIRESTVGQLRSHTLENKIAIYDQVKKCGMEHIIVATFSHMPRVDDDFAQYLKDKGEDFSKLYSFSELSNGLKGGRYDGEQIPISCQKNKKYGLYNTIFEIDLANPECRWGDLWTVKDEFDLLMKRVRWVRSELNASAKIMVNLRDFSTAMTREPKRLLDIVRLMSSLPKEERISAVIYEDLGESLPDELGRWTASVRAVMDGCGWKDSGLYIHVHQQWDLQTASVLQCLENGANGVWCSICDEGAAVGHASSVVTAMNLVRFGNTKILKRYDCAQMRQAAREVTRITTGKYPHPRQVLYGDRALDMVFGFPVQVVRSFDLATFFGVTPVNRISTLASPEMIRQKLVNDFGDQDIFTMEIATQMKDVMIEDLRTGRKEEYMSKVGIAVLFDRSGGKLSSAMCDVIASTQVHNRRHKDLIANIRKDWDAWDLQDNVQGDEQLQFDSFYHGFMAPYFSCYSCETTKQALQALDMDSDGYVDWKEFLVYIKWALNEYPDVASADDLLDLTFQKGLIPAMRDEQVRRGSVFSAERSCGNA